MRVAYTRTARRQLKAQLDYLISRGAGKAARAAHRRINNHLRRFLAVYPKTGKFLPGKGVYEAWIPNTRYVVFYRLADDTLRVLALYHTAQDRDAFDPADADD